MSNKRQLRWGRKGSFVLIVAGEKKGLWFDHENGVGGDIINFLARDNNCSIADAIRLALSYLGCTESVSPKRSRPTKSELDESARISRALEIWSEVQPLRGSLAEQYLEHRGVSVPDNSLEVIGFHPNCPFGRRKAPALLGLIQDITTGEPIGIHRRELTPNAVAVGAPMSLGEKSGGVIKLSPIGDAGELAIGEGVETCLSGMMLGFSPAWSAIDAGGLASFPVLEEVGRLTILVDHDQSGTGQGAAASCRERWLSAGKAVRRVTPETIGDDANDLLLAQIRQAREDA